MSREIDFSDPYYVANMYDCLDRRIAALEAKEAVATDKQQLKPKMQGRSEWVGRERNDMEKAVIVWVVLLVLGLLCLVLLVDYNNDSIDKKICSRLDTIEAMHSAQQPRECNNFNIVDSKKPSSDKGKNDNF